MTSDVDVNFVFDKNRGKSTSVNKTFFLSFSLFLSFWREVVFCLSQESQLSAIISPLLFLVRGAEGGWEMFSGSTHCKTLLTVFVADYCAITNCCPEGCFPVN